MSRNNIPADTKRSAAAIVVEEDDDDDDDIFADAPPTAASAPMQVESETMSPVLSLAASARQSALAAASESTPAQRLSAGNSSAAAASSSDFKGPVNTVLQQAIAYALQLVQSGALTLHGAEAPEEQPASLSIAADLYKLSASQLQSLMRPALPLEDDLGELNTPPACSNGPACYLYTIMETMRARGAATKDGFTILSVVDVADASCASSSVDMKNKTIKPTAGMSFMPIDVYNAFRKGHQVTLPQLLCVFCMRQMMCQLLAAGMRDKGGIAARQPLSRCDVKCTVDGKTTTRKLPLICQLFTVTTDQVDGYSKEDCYLPDPSNPDNVVVAPFPMLKIPYLQLAVEYGPKTKTPMFYFTEYAMHYQPNVVHFQRGAPSGSSTPLH